jgi:Domain of unknown function (DUF6484)
MSAVKDSAVETVEQIAAVTSGEAREFIGGVIVGKLVAFGGDGATPLVIFAGQPGTAALVARSIVDLHGAHVGHEVVLMFEDGKARLPIVMGVVRGAADVPAARQLQVDTDGERLVVSAREQLVLRCGKASITLTRAGKVLVQGTYVTHRSTGVVRIKGGSVQLN